MRSPSLSALAVLLLLPATLPAQERETGLSADAIIEKVIERARQNQERAPHISYTYTQFEVTEQLDADGAVREREERVYQLVPIEGEHYQRLVKVDGQPLAGKQLREEQKREQEFRRALAEGAEPPGQRSRVTVDETLFGRFQIDLAGEERLNGRPAYVLSFGPRPHNLPERNRIEKMMRRVSGRFWVDQQDYEIVRVQARLIDPIRIAWGLVFTLEDARFRLDRTALGDGTWLPASMSAYIKGRRFFSAFHQRTVNEWGDYSRVPAQQGELASTTD